MASLLLAGAVSAQQGWDADPNSHSWSSNTPIVATVQIDGVAQTDLTNLTLGAFAGDELRGRANVANNSVYDNENNNGQFWIQVYYNYNTTEAISFKLYDAINQTVYATCEVTKPTQDEGWGTYDNPVELNFTNAPQTETQTIALIAGWNWVSFNVVADDLLPQLEQSLGENGLTIESANYMTEFDGEEWFGDLDDEGINNLEMYRIEVGADCSVSLQGTAASTATYSITIKPGYNWIGFPCGEEAEISVALANFAAEEGDQIEGASGMTEFDGEEWFGDIETLIPGQGYYYYSASDETKTLVFSITLRNGANGQ